MLSNYIKEENEKRRREINDEKIMSETEDKIVVPIPDKPEISKKVKVDLEVDTSIKDLDPNPYAKIIHMVKADAWRIFPRLFLTVYIILLYKCVIVFI